MTSRDSGESSLSGRRGLETWTHTLRDEMCSGTSLRVLTGVWATRSSLQPTGMAASGRGEAMWRSADRLERSDEYRSADTAHMFGKGRCWSA